MDWQAEEWRLVVGWPQYQVSSLGNVRKMKTGKPVGQWLNNQGYSVVRFSQPRKMQRVHRLVAAAFILNPAGYLTVNHINSKRDDNRVGNLEWCSQADNLAHADAKGRMQRDYWVGKRSPSALASDQQVIEIRGLYTLGDTSWADLGRRFGLSKRAIGRILRRETYADVQ